MITDRAEGGVLRRVRLKNYRSIKQCDVELGQFNVFVGANGAGKSNFLDALRLTAESVKTTLPHALQERGGLAQVRRSTSTRHAHVSVRLDFSFQGYERCFYAYELREEQGGPIIKREQAALGEAFFEVREGEVVASSIENFPKVTSDRLALVAVSGWDIFRPLYDVVAGFGFYNIIPERVRVLQRPDVGHSLHRDGSNLASVVRALDESQRGMLCDYLRVIVPGIEDVEAKALGNMMTLAFSQRRGDERRLFYANQMSEGTLRALALLAALLGPSSDAVVGIEEPESALHPGAVDMLVEVMAGMPHGRQVLITTHSPELLDMIARSEVTHAKLFAVQSDEGETEIGPLDEATTAVLRDALFEPGELLRMGQLIGEPARATSIKIFEAVLGGAG